MESYKLKKINFTGVSGTGKTTLAKWIEEEFNVPFLSGSYSDLVPNTKNMPHSDMIIQDAKTIYEQDFQVLNLRNKLFSSHDNYVSDRSYLDSAAYLINKLSHRIKECDTENFLEICRVLTVKQITHLIFIPFDENYLKKWEIEDNHKRVLNRYYQWEVSELMFSILFRLWGFRILKNTKSEHNLLETIGTISYEHDNIYYTTKVQILYAMDLEERKRLIRRFLKL